MAASNKSNKTKLDLKFVKSPKFYIPASIFMGIVVVGIAGVLIWKPGIARGEYDIQSIVNMLLNHEQRIKEVEVKTDNTQTQTNQNSADINKLQENTNTGAAETVPAVTTPVTTSNPVVETPTTPTPIVTTPMDPNDVTWTNSHGTFAYKNMPSTMYTGKDNSIMFGWSSSSCEGFKANQVNLIPANTKIISSSQVPSWAQDNSTKYYLDLSDYYRQKCGLTATPTNSYYFSFPISNQAEGSYFPGKWDIWW